MNQLLKRRCGHSEECPPPKPGYDSPEFILKKVRRFQSRDCQSCTSARGAAEIEQHQKAKEARLLEKHQSKLHNIRLKILSRLPTEYHDTPTLSYLQISQLQPQHANWLPLPFPVDPEAIKDLSNSRLEKMHWEWVGLLAERLAAAGYPLRWGYEPAKQDWFASVRIADEWLGMRSHSLPLAVIKSALMVHCQAWPPTRSLSEKRP